jgi:molybdopterin converting factor subunit 1
VVKVLYFAALQELMGRAEEQFELPPDVQTVRDFVRHLERVRPALAGKMSSVRIALDETFANDSDALQGSHVIALIPPVAGG